MTYQILARKWRPQDFSSLIGQEPIVTALRNALTEGRIAQAYLFSGIRGIGKTTAARVLAKALNCERGPGRADPCNVCRPCREITAGSDLDTIEVDAATYSKVEQVRELTETLRYAPARNRYKVVVIDEIHRLSRQAFDALLKIVEEPPPHLVFIFATTEIDAVPATLLSRCQEFQFRRVPSPVLAAHLRRLADAESITVSDPALRLIARAGEGSVRDSVALLDQLATFGGGTISDQDANHLLGGVDAAVFHRLLAAIVEGEPATVSATVAEIERRGWDPQNVFGQFLTYARDALHLAMGGEPESVDLPGEDAVALAELVRPLGYENLLRLTQHLLASEPTVRRSELGSLALEIAWLRAAELPKLIRVEELLAGKASVKLPAAARVLPAASAPDPSERRTPKARTPEARTPEARTPENRVPERPEAAAPDPPPAAVPEPRAAPPAEPPGARLVRFKELLSGRRQALAALLNGAVELVFRDGELVICAPSGDTLIQRAVERPANAELLRELLREVWGEGVGFRICATEAQAATDPQVSLIPPRSPLGTRGDAPAHPQGDPAGEGPAVPSREDEFARVRENPAVQAVLEIFDGTIRSVEPGAP